MAGRYETDPSTHYLFQPNGPFQRRLARTLEQAARQTRGSLLVDVCCGTGNVLRSARAFFPHCLGVDLSVNMLQQARQRHLEVLGADANRLPLVDECADCVTAVSALHHMFDYEAVLKEMARILRRGGILYTDWDPNGHVLRQGWAVTSATRLLMGLRRWRNGDSIPETSLQQLAEYHHHSREGFDPDRAMSVLRHLGFREVRLYCHCNPDGFGGRETARAQVYLLRLLKLLSFIPPTARNVHPWVGIVAIK
ncbi:MAG: methyltransferase domain-containing protein [Magnetococcales bacterium]|nr:methyltransferase domain-containing protein [Magnetococcales bacterium]